MMGEQQYVGTAQLVTNAQVRISYPWHVQLEAMPWQNKSHALLVQQGIIAQHSDLISSSAHQEHINQAQGRLFVTPALLDLHAQYRLKCQLAVQQAHILPWET